MDFVNSFSCGDFLLIEYNVLEISIFIGFDVYQI